MKNRRKYILAAIVFLIVIIAVGFIIQPDASEFRSANPKKTALMIEREAAWKAKGRKRSISQNWVQLKHISPYLVKAVIISEDDKFWEHEGFDYEALKAAMQKDIKSGKLKSGGSTISQQLVKNLYLTPRKSFVRKAREAVITWKMERALTKSRIIELYLNIAEWGDGIFGAQAASRYYFNKDAADLTPMEAARLAVALPSPGRLDPAGEGKYLAARAQVIYDIMVRRGIVEPDYGEYEGVIGPSLDSAGTGEAQKTQKDSVSGPPATDKADRVERAGGDRKPPAAM